VVEPKRTPLKKVRLVEQARREGNNSSAAAVVQAIVGLRAGGMRERNIYEALRDVMKAPPSYRDVRDVLTHNGLRFKAQVRERHSGIGRRWEASPDYVNGGHYVFTGTVAKVGRQEIHTLSYLNKRQEFVDEHSRRLKNGERAMSDARFEVEMTKLDKNYASGYLGMAFAAQDKGLSRLGSDILEPEAYGQDEFKDDEAFKDIVYP